MRKPRARTGWTVYILRCADGSLYTGVTRDIARRVIEHNSNGRLAARYTRARRPVVLVYRETARTRSAACRREYRIKQLTRRGKEELVATLSLRVRVLSGAFQPAAQQAVRNRRHRRCPE